MNVFKSMEYVVPFMMTLKTDTDELMKALSIAW